MVLDMVAHHESAMNDRLSGKLHPMSQAPHHNNANIMPSVAQYENVVEDPAERTQHQSQANKAISKEVRARTAYTRDAFAGPKVTSFFSLKSICTYFYI